MQRKDNIKCVFNLFKICWLSYEKGENVKKLLIIFTAICLTFIVPYGFAKVISGFFNEWFIDNSAANFFVGVFSHRLAQVIISLTLLVIVAKWKDIKTNFRLDHVRAGIYSFRWIAIFWPILTILFFFISVRFIDGFNQYLCELYPPGSNWILAKVGCDFLLLDAFAEEILNRAVIITILAKAFNKSLSIGKLKLSYAALISVPLFALSHVQVSFFPFGIISYDYIQLGLTVITGLLFAYAYEKTQRILVPIFLHGFTNLTITVCAYLSILYF